MSEISDDVLNNGLLARKQSIFNGFIEKGDEPDFIDPTFMDLQKAKEGDLDSKGNYRLVKVDGKLRWRSIKKHESKKEETGGAKKEDKEQKEADEEYNNKKKKEYLENAKKMTESELKEIIKTSKTPLYREVAHAELDRRNKEEKPEKEEKKETKPKKEIKKPDNTEKKNKEKIDTVFAKQAKKLSDKELTKRISDLKDAIKKLKGSGVEGIYTKDAKEAIKGGEETLAIYEKEVESRKKESKIDITAKTHIDLIKEASKAGTTKVEVKFVPAYDDKLHSNLSEALKDSLKKSKIQELDSSEDYNIILKLVGDKDVEYIKFVKEEKKEEEGKIDARTKAIGLITGGKVKTIENAGYKISYGKLDDKSKIALAGLVGPFSRRAFLTEGLTIDKTNNTIEKKESKEIKKALDVLDLTEEE